MRYAIDPLPVLGIVRAVCCGGDAAVPGDQNIVAGNGFTPVRLTLDKTSPGL